MDGQYVANIGIDLHRCVGKMDTVLWYYLFI